MSLFYNRVKFAATTTGTADFTVGAAVTGFQTPSVASIPNGTLISYAAFSASGTEWETGQGSYASAGPSILRTTVFDSSAGFGTKQNFTASPTVQLDLLARDLIFSPVLSTWQLGPSDAAAPVAQTFQVQSVAGGTSNTAGVDFTINGSKGTGTAAGGKIIFQVAPTGGAGSSQNALGNALVIFNQSRIDVGNASNEATLNNPNPSGGVSLAINGTNYCYINTFNEFSLNNVGAFAWSGTSNAGATHDLLMTRAAAACLQLGKADAAAPVAQTLQVQNVVAGTSNTAGANFIIEGSQGTGTGAGGTLAFKTAPAGTTGTSQNAQATALTLTAPAVSQQPSVVIGNQALATNATDGFLYIPTCAGPPTGTPTAQTGRVAMIYDTTNNKFYIYNGAWKGGTAPGTFT